MYEEDLTNLEEWLRRLKVEYDIFFNGHRKRPPDDLRARVEKVVKKLSECSEMSFQERFRYNTLVARFYVFRDLWRRTIQEREISAAEALPEKGKASAEGTAGLESGGIHVSLTDPVMEEEKVRQLYEGLLRMRGTRTQEALRITYPQFAKYITNQTRDIRERFKCSSVMFTVAFEDDAIKFTAKAEKNR
jgi:hypothetical protein